MLIILEVLLVLQPCEELIIILIVIAIGAYPPIQQLLDGFEARLNGVRMHLASTDPAVIADRH